MKKVMGAAMVAMVLVSSMMAGQTTTSAPLQEEVVVVEPNADLVELNTAGEVDSPCKRSIVGCVFNGMFQATASIKESIDAVADTVFAPLEWLAEKIEGKK